MLDPPWQRIPGTGGARRGQAAGPAGGVLKTFHHTPDYGGLTRGSEKCPETAKAGGVWGGAPGVSLSRNQN
ncbi:MAG: hypothetical protein LBJ82_06045, partial [Deltaproteobacteria bacterium]|nr:hypothetical protein [Deltaproteobacteria bacterium]